MYTSVVLRRTRWCCGRDTHWSTCKERVTRTASRCWRSHSWMDSEGFWRIPNVPGWNFLFILYKIIQVSISIKNKNMCIYIYYTYTLFIDTYCTSYWYSIYKHTNLYDGRSHIRSRVISQPLILRRTSELELQGKWSDMQASTAELIGSNWFRQFVDVEALKIIEASKHSKHPTLPFLFALQVHISSRTCLFTVETYILLPCFVSSRAGQRIVKA